MHDGYGRSRLRPATRADYTRNGWTPPTNFEDEPELRFGPPGFERHQIGWSEPTVRMTETTIHEKYGPIQHGHPVPESEVEQRLAEGWTLGNPV